MKKVFLATLAVGAMAVMAVGSGVVSGVDTLQPQLAADRDCTNDQTRDTVQERAQDGSCQEAVTTTSGIILAGGTPRDGDPAGEPDRDRIRDC